MKYKNLYIFTLLDQIIVSGSSFLITILLIKFAGIKFFGEFSFIWLLNYFVLGFQTSLITSPMFTLYPKILDEKRAVFLGNLFYLFLIFTAIISFILVIGMNFFTKLIDLNLSFKSIISAVTCIILFQFHNLIKRFCYCIKKNYLSFYSDLLTYTVFFIILMFFLKNESIDLNIFFYSYSFSLLIGSFFFLLIVKKIQFNLKFFKEHFLHSWKISKWLSLSNLCYWFTYNFWFIASGAILGPVTYGILKSMANIAGFYNLIYQSLEYLFPQKISEEYVNNKTSGMINYAIKFTTMGIMVGLIFLISIYFFGELLIALLYNEELTKFAWFLYTFSLINFFQFFIYPINFILRTLDYTKPIFFSYLLAAIFTLLFSNFIINKLNETGVFLGILISNILIIAVTYLFMKREINRVK